MPSPALTGVAATATYGENLVNASPQLIDPTVVFTDSDNNFNGGALTITGLLAEDRVAVRNEGTGAGQIGVSGSNILFGNVVIGSFTGGVGNAFTVTFNSSATAAAIDALIQNLTYANVSDTPTADRTLTLDVVDAAGGHLPGFSSFSQVSGASSPVNNLTYGTNDSLIRASFADFDGDGDLDAFVSSYNGAYGDGPPLAAYRNNGNGTFTSVTNPLNSGLIFGAVAFLDIDGDGDLDAVVGHGQTISFRTFQRQPGNTFVELTGGNNPFGNADPNYDFGDNAAPAAVDVDGDGRTDMVWTSGAGEVHYFHHNADHSFTALTGAANPFENIHLNSGFTFKTVTFADVDGDGDPDMVASNGTTIRYFRNIAGTFTEQTGAYDSQGNGNPFNGVSGTGPLTPVFADFDGDGDSELVVGQAESVPYLFFQNNGTHGHSISVHVTAEADNTAPTANANTGLTLNEGATGTLATAQLDFNDAEQADSAIVYTVTSAATNGTLRRNGVTLNVNDTFTQADINNGLISYLHNGSETTSGSFGFSVSDGVAAAITGQTFAFTVTPQNDEAILSADTRNLTETDDAGDIGASGTLTIDDVDSAETFAAQAGTVGLYGTFAIDTAGAWTYTASSAHDEFVGATVYTDTFTVASADGTTTSVTINITGANDAPDQAVNAGQTANEGGSVVITSSELEFDDPDQQAADSAMTYTVTSVATNGTVQVNGTPLGLGGTFTQDDVNNGRVTYVHGGSETTTDSFGFSVSDGDGEVSAGHSFALVITPTDDPSNAVDDTAPDTDENATVNFSVVSNDTDIDSGVEGVALIAGQSATVGVAITLDSGATVTIESDGTLTYDPNGSFNYLVSAATAASYGASNGSAADSFTYTLAGGDTATVTVTVNGLDGGGDQIWGTGGSDDLSGSSGSNLFNLSQGGDDTAEGGGGSDGFLFGATFDANDHVDGGEGTLDQIGLQGDYSGGLTLAADSITGVELFVLMAGNDDRFGGATGTQLDYVITTHNNNVGDGDTLYFQANGLREGESFTLDASAETDGTIFVYGGFGTEDLTGGQSTDAFYFGTGRFGSNDRVDGNSGTNDTLALQGSYSLASGGSGVTFGADQIFNIDILALQTSGDSRFGGGGPGPYGYDITMNDANVAVGERLVVSANMLASDELLDFDGSDESDGFFTIYAGAGGDTITGGQLGDRIYGRGGADTMSGGGGNDAFVYMAAADSTLAAMDSILDFQTGDLVDLSAIDADATTDGNQTFAFFGATVTTTVGSLYYADNGDGTYTVFGHTDNDGTADFVLQITKPDPVVEGDFVL